MSGRVFILLLALAGIFGNGLAQNQECAVAKVMKWDAKTFDVMYCLSVADCESSKHTCDGCKAVTVNNLNNLIAMYNYWADKPLDINEASYFKRSEGGLCGNINKDKLRMIKLEDENHDQIQYYTEEKCHKECWFGCHEVAMTKNLAGQLNNMQFSGLKLYSCDGWPFWLYILATALVCCVVFSIAGVLGVIVWLCKKNKEKKEFENASESERAMRSSKETTVEVEDEEESEYLNK